MAIQFLNSLDVNGATQLDGELNVGVNDTGHDVRFYGATSGKYLMWDQSADTLIVVADLSLHGPITLGTDDTGHDVTFYGATTGKKMKWDESADTLIVDGVLDVNGNVDISGTITMASDQKQSYGNASTFIEGMTSGSKLGVYGQTDILLRIGGSTVISMDNAKCEFSIPAIPATSDGVALGSTTKMWSDLFLASGGVVNFNNGDMTLTHSSNTLTVAGGTFATAALTATTGTFTGAVTIPEYIVHSGDTNTYFGFSGADTFKVFTGGSERLVVNSSGMTTGQNITASNVIVDDDGQIGSASATGAMEIADDGVVSFNGGISAAGNVKSTIKTRVGAVTSSTDGDYKMGDVVYFGGTTSMTTGAIYHYKSDGTWELADADAASTCDGLLGIALGAASNTNGVLLRGFVTLDHDPGAVGDVLYVSTTAGDTTATAPSGSGDIVRVIGYCLHASSGMIYFNPDGTFVEVA